MVEKGKQVDGLYLDLVKTFDSINNGLLIEKMKFMLHWLQSLFKIRQLKLRVGDTLPDLLVAPSGVLQGNHFHPVWFLVYVQDLAEVMKYIDVDFSLGTNDLKLSRVISSLDDCTRQQSAF